MVLMLLEKRYCVKSCPDGFLCDILPSPNDNVSFRLFEIKHLKSDIFSYPLSS